MGRVTLCEVRGLLVDTIEKLSGEDGAEWAERLKSTLRKDDLLRRITEVAVSATKKFIAKDHIKSVNVGYMNDNFKLFLNKIEEDVPNAELVISELKKASLDAPIMTELGSKKRIFLAHFFELLEHQSKGQAGPLLTNGYAIVGYVQDDEGNFWAVDARWDSIYRCWCVYAYSVDSPAEWRAGYRVLSCK